MNYSQYDYILKLTNEIALDIDDKTDLFAFIYICNNCEARILDQKISAKIVMKDFNQLRKVLASIKALHFQKLDIRSENNEEFKLVIRANDLCLRNFKIYHFKAFKDTFKSIKNASLLLDQCSWLCKPDKDDQKISEVIELYIIDTKFYEDIADCFS